MNEPFPDRLRRTADAFAPGRPDTAQITHRGRVRKARKTAAVGGVGVLSMLAIALPLYLLSGLGHPTPDHPGTHKHETPPIAFVDANGRIALMRPDGSGVQQITTGHERDPYVARYGSSQDSNPQWTPGGHAIYFLRRYSEAVYSLCSVSPTGSGFRVAVRNFPSGEFAISPSGTQVAFTAGNGVFVSGIDGSSQHRIVRFPGFPYGTSVTWSPNGKEIAFVSGSQELWVAELSGDLRVWRVTRAGAHVSFATWDPTGAVIAYTLMKVNSNGALDSSQVWTIRSDGSGARRVTDGHGYWTSTAWSPGGSHLLLGRLDSKLRDDGLAIINADGSGLQVISKGAQSGFASWRQ